mmetsp:Transcript_99765/g.215235  ORF Transcript_99765/g.215235 Transcript_99765/m.215235 type:complete len:290 (-) Transcript_99765:196-1065(-)
MVRLLSLLVVGKVEIVAGEEVDTEQLGEEDEVDGDFHVAQGIEAYFEVLVVVRVSPVEAERSAGAERVAALAALHVLEFGEHGEAGRDVAPLDHVPDAVLVVVVEAQVVFLSVKLQVEHVVAHLLQGDLTLLALLGAHQLDPRSPAALLHSEEILERLGEGHALALHVAHGCARALALRHPVVALLLELGVAHLAFGFDSGGPPRGHQPRVYELLDLAQFSVQVGLEDDLLLAFNRVGQHGHEDQVRGVRLLQHELVRVFHEIPARAQHHLLRHRHVLLQLESVEGLNP